MIEDLISKAACEAVAVAYYELESGKEILILPDLPFHAASTMKVCVMMELFRQASVGNLSLDERIPIHNCFSSIVDGSPYSIDPAEDSELDLYEQIDETESLIRLAEPMITHSSNLATNLLVERLGAERITAYMRELGAPGLSVLRGVEDGKAYRQGLNNQVTARGLTTILTKLALGQVVSEDASSDMVGILVRQAHRNCIPAGLPHGTRVANKTGWNDGICHDTGIVFPEDRSPYVLTVLTKGIADQPTAAALIASISAAVYERR